MKKNLTKILLYFLKDDIWEVCGNISERFYDRDDGNWDDLQEKLYYWFTAGLRNV